MYKLKSLTRGRLDTSAHSGGGAYSVLHEAALSGAQTRLLLSFVRLLKRWLHMLFLLLV